MQDEVSIIFHFLFIFFIFLEPTKRLQLALCLGKSQPEQVYQGK